VRLAPLDRKSLEQNGANVAFQLLYKDHGKDYVGSRQQSLRATRSTVNQSRPESKHNCSSDQTCKTAMNERTRSLCREQWALKPLKEQYQVLEYAIVSNYKLSFTRSLQHTSPQQWLDQLTTVKHRCNFQSKELRVEIDTRSTRLGPMESDKASKPVKKTVGVVRGA
jgi:hypothetical protein